MILPLDELIGRLQSGANPNDTKPSDALWIRFSQEKTQKTVEYRTADGNEIVHVYLDQNGALVGVEIFP
jgi:uncharacterized protein YuzE